MRSLAFFLALIAVASAAVIPPPPPVPSECPMYLLSQPANLQTPSGLLENVMIYNPGAGNLMTGQPGAPTGPYFQLIEGSNCFWIPSGQFSCDTRLYADQAHSKFLGFGRLRSSNLLASSNTQLPGFHFVGGDVTLSTNFSDVPPGYSSSDARFTNFRAQTTTLHFTATQMFPDVSTGQPPVANGVENSTSTRYMTLWGSNGWDGTTWPDAARTTGFDIRSVLTCTNMAPPVPTPPSPCPDCTTLVTVPEACNTQGRTIEHTRASNCMILNFANSGDVNAFQGCTSR